MCARVVEYEQQQLAGRPCRHAVRRITKNDGKNYKVNPSYGTTKPSAAAQSNVCDKRPTTDGGTVGAASSVRFPSLSVRKHLTLADAGGYTYSTHRLIIMHFNVQ